MTYESLFRIGDLGVRLSLDKPAQPGGKAHPHAPLGPLNLRIKQIIWMNTWRMHYQLDRIFSKTLSKTLSNISNKDFDIRGLKGGAWLPLKKRI